jgi:hypothetical protein
MVALFTYEVKNEKVQVEGMRGGDAENAENRGLDGGTGAKTCTKGQAEGGRLRENRSTARHFVRWPAAGSRIVERTGEQGDTEERMP